MISIKVYFTKIPLVHQEADEKSDNLTRNEQAERTYPQFRLLLPKHHRHVSIDLARSKQVPKLPLEEGFLTWQEREKKTQRNGLRKRDVVRTIMDVYFSSCFFFFSF